MPGAIGVNPLLTIGAVAERAMELLCIERGWTIDWSVATSRPLPAADKPPKRTASGAIDHSADDHGMVASIKDLFHKVVGHIDRKSVV